MLDFNRYDAYGQVLKPGDVCVAKTKDKGPRFCIYKHEVKKSRRGEYGRFITEKGVTTIKFTNVVFVFDTLTDRRGKTEAVNELVRAFYEDIR